MTEIKKQKKFPHISRIITAANLRRIAPLFVALGIFMIGVANVAAFTKLPELARSLMRNPVDAHELTAVASNIRVESAQRVINEFLLAHGKENIITDVVVAKQKRAVKLAEVTMLIEQFPRYPDAHAYKSILLLEEGQCDHAKKEIQKARELDPNRKKLQEIEREIKESCVSL